MKRYFANLILRLAFRIFQRYHEQLPKELNGIIWGEMTRRSEPPKDYSEMWCIEREGEKRLCSMCLSELEEDRANQETVKR